MTLRFNEGESSSVDLMEATEQLYRDAAEGLFATLQGVRAGDLGEVKAVVAAVKDLKAAFNLALEERNKIEKLRKQVAGSVGSGHLDFDAARDEIGRRLARLRDAG